MTLAAENVVGALLIEPAAYWRIADMVRTEDFGDLAPLFARIVQAVKAGEQFDAVTAWDEGFANAVDLARDTFTTANLESWARKVADASEAGKVRAAGERIAQCSTYAQALDLLAAVRPQQAARMKTVTDGLSEMVETLQHRYNAGGALTGVPTGVDSLDVLTGGWQPGNLIVLVGETSMGKSAFALQSALAAAAYAKDRGQCVLYFSLEMTAGELTERAVANLADMPMRWMTYPADAPDYAMDRVTAGSRLLTELPLFIDDQCNLSLDDVVSRTTQVHMRTPVALVVVDYMHIMARPRRNDVAELGGIATGLKNLSKTLGVPVMGLHQLNRGTAGMNRDRRPTLFDIRASGEIAETANTVLAIYRSEVARPDYSPLKETAEALILKQRQGRRDVRAWMRSRLANMRLESIEAPEGYDDTITKDHDAAGTTGGNGQVDAGGSGVRTRTQPTRVPQTRWTS